MSDPVPFMSLSCTSSSTSSSSAQMYPVSSDPSAFFSPTNAPLHAHPFRLQVDPLVKVEQSNSESPLPEPPLSSGASSRSEWATPTPLCKSIVESAAAQLSPVQLPGTTSPLAQLTMRSKHHPARGLMKAKPVGQLRTTAIELLRLLSLLGLLRLPERT